MTKIVKSVIKERMYSEMPFEVTNTECKLMLDAMLNVITNELCSGNMVRIHKAGKFIPFVAKERLVRNPKTREPVLLESRNSIAFSKAGFNSSVNRMNENGYVVTMTDLIKMVTNRLNIIESMTLSRAFYEIEQMADVTVRLFSEMLRQAIEDNVTVEIRGLGVLKIKSFIHKCVRNPKTGEMKNEPKELKRVSFRPSKTLLRRLNKF